MALRLKYARHVVDRTRSSRAWPQHSTAAVAAAPGRVFALPTYNAMLALRDELVGRGVAGSSFG